MDCCRFTEQMTRIIPSFAGFTEFTTSIPKMYWDVKSAEQRTLGLCRMLDKVICYADMLGENVDEIKKALQEIEEGKLDNMIIAAVAAWLEEHENEIAALTVDVIAPELQSIKCSDFKETRFLARLFSADYTGTTNAQSACLIDDMTMLCAYTNSDTNNNTVLVLVDLDAAEVIRTYPSQFGHCNGMCYNPDNDKVYICPAGDYAQNPPGHTGYFYICNSTTLAVEETVSTYVYDASGHPHSVCYDKITGRMFMTFYQHGTGAIKLYELDPATNELEYMCIVPTAQSELNKHYAQNMTGGTQDINAYNGELYYLIGGNSTTAIINIDEDGAIKNIIGVKDDVYIYSMIEAQAFDFNSFGDIVMFGNSSTVSDSYRYVAIYGINFNGGMMIDATKTNPYNGIEYTAYVDEGNNSTYTLAPTGSSSNPYPTLDEALASVASKRYRDIRISSASGTYSIKPSALNNVDVYIHADNSNNVISLRGTVQTHSKLNITQGTLALEEAQTHMLSPLNAEISLYYVTIDATNCTAEPIYSTNGDLHLAGVTVTNQTSEYTIDGRNNTYASIVSSPTVSSYNVISEVRRYIGIVGDTFSKVASGSPNGEWVTTLSNEFGYKVVNASVNGSGFNEGTTNFVTQFTNICNNSHFSEMEYIIVYGGLYDFTNNETIANMTTAFNAIKTAYDNATSNVDVKPKLVFAFGNLGLPKRTAYNGYQKWYAQCMTVLRNMGMPGLVEYVPYWLVFLKDIADYFESDSTRPSSAGQKIIASMFTKILNGSYTGVKREYYFDSSYIDTSKFTNFSAGHIKYTFDNGVTSLVAAITADSVNTDSALDTQIINQLDSVSPYIGDTSGTSDFVLLFGTPLQNGSDKTALFMFNAHNTTGSIRARGTAQGQSYPITGVNAIGNIINE